MTENESKWSGSAINSIGYAVIVWLVILVFPIPMVGGALGYVLAIGVTVVWIIAILDGMKAWSEIRRNAEIKGKVLAIIGILISVFGIVFFAIFRVIPALSSPCKLTGG